MMKSHHHRLLFFGFLLLAGAVSVIFQQSKKIGAVDTSLPVWTFSTASRSSRSKVEPLAYSASFVRKPARLTRRDYGTAEPASYANGLRPGEMAALQAANVTQPDDGLPVERSSRQEVAGSMAAGLSDPEHLSSQAQSWRTTDPSTPGGQLSFNNQLASVTASQPVPGTNGVTLSVVLEEIAPDKPVAVESPDVPETAPGETAVISASDLIVRTGRFTHEQELFRTKWGWAAYDQVQKALREATSD